MTDFQNDTNDQIPNKRLLTIGELADFLQVKRSWFYGQTRIAERTGFPLVRCGKYCRFDLNEVLGWLKNGSSQVAPKSR